MKICPKCQKNYSDDSLNFCMEDGTVLTLMAAGFNEPPETVMINQARPTSGGQQFGSHRQPNDWSAKPLYPVKPQKNSNNWLLIAGILGGLVLLCGGGFIGLIAFVSNIENEPRGNTNFALNTVNTIKADKKSASDDRKELTKIDLSNWNKDFSEYGNTDFRNDVLVMSSKKNNFYYVLVAPAVHKTENSTTKLSVRNIANGNNSLGYGLIIHSNPVPLQQDYAFLIDSKTQRYRIVTHKPQKEENVVSWTKSTSIKEGTQENVLEVRDENVLMSFYINGDFITSLRNSDGYKDGVAGIYVGGASPIGFSNLEIRK